MHARRQIAYVLCLIINMAAKHGRRRKWPWRRVPNRSNRGSFNPALAGRPMLHCFPFTRPSKRRVVVARYTRTDLHARRSGLSILSFLSFPVVVTSFRFDLPAGAGPPSESLDPIL